ncbi:hypothetical protein UFOVP346_13 [uncultured Caudovirales phage]|uniref:Uncharacterized protein n=1 Tax=uncultured Caudovirales phage TaxID=2100421 RepID=A0A6J5LWY6_9CAUD|nr:hypothetical protein UFOVP346_13 [uncultured Caudovirales phage]
MPLDFLFTAAVLLASAVVASLVIQMLLAKFWEDNFKDRD